MRDRSKMMDFSMDDVLNAVGLQRAQHDALLTSTILPAAGLFGAGLLIGAGLGLLFAPKPGREIREEIGERFRSSDAETPAEATV